MVVVGVVSVGACSPFGGGAFHCATSDQCAGGTCEPEGLCSFFDSGCMSGRRFGDQSGPLAGVCVSETPTDGSMPDQALDDGDVDTMIAIDVAAPFCDSAGDPTLVGCWEFENNANDASGDANNATAQNVTYATGKVGMAAVLQGNSSLVVGDRASLEPQHLTIEGWVKPSQAPGGGNRWGIFDSDGAYGVFITNTTFLCSLNGALTVNVTLPINQWTHFACTSDGAQVHLFVDGIENPVSITGQPLGTGNNNGIVIAGDSPSGNDRFLGAIDQFRVFNEARTPTQICLAAGRTTCP
jgi:Concanavalin A-like lectin/glucanases superfamily